MTAGDDGTLPSARTVDAVMMAVDNGITGGFEEAAPSGSGRAAASTAAAAAAGAASPSAALPPKPKFAALSAHDANGRRIEFRRV
jgi:hypothetical protein